MTRLDLLKIVIGRARANGFEFRRWYVTRLALPWINLDAALTVLDAQRRYYALLFHHDFARCFWKAGEDITFAVAARSFERIMPDGSVSTVTRKPYIRRSARRDAWRYHLQQMALAEEPLRYIRKYLHVSDDLEEDSVTPADAVAELRDEAIAPAQHPEAATADEAPLDAKLEAPPKPGPRSTTSRTRKNVAAASVKPPSAVARAITSPRARPLPRPLPTDLPAFLQRKPERD